MKSIVESINEAKNFFFALVVKSSDDKVKIFSVKTNYNGVDDFASDIAVNDDDADTIESWFKVGVQYSRYDGFNDKFKKFLESVKVTKDNFYTIMPIQNMKTRPNAVYNFN